MSGRLPSPSSPRAEARRPATVVSHPRRREESLVEMAMLLALRRGHPPKVEGVSDPADPDHAGRHVTAQLTRG
jgi:hypothetical protein